MAKKDTEEKTRKKSEEEDKVDDDDELEEVSETESSSDDEDGESGDLSDLGDLPDLDNMDSDELEDLLHRLQEQEAVLRASLKEKEAPLGLFNWRTILVAVLAVMMVSALVLAWNIDENKLQHRNPGQIKQSHFARDHPVDSHSNKAHPTSNQDASHPTSNQDASPPDQEVDTKQEERGAAVEVEVEVGVGGHVVPDDSVYRDYQRDIQHEPDPSAVSRSPEEASKTESRDAAENRKLEQEAKRKREAILRKFPRVHINDLMLPENLEFYKMRKPFVLTGAMQGWAATDMWDPEYFTEYYPEDTIDFYPHNMRDAGVHPYLERFDVALHELYNPTPGRYRDKPDQVTEPGTYLQWNITPDRWKDVVTDTGTLPSFFRLDDRWLPICLRNKENKQEFFLRTHWRMVLIGDKGAGMFNHQDSIRTGAWQAQVAGVKKWFICGPDQSPNVGPAGAVRVFNPDYSATPQFRNADCIVDEVVPGEIVYYPADYWHSTMCMSDWTVGVVGTVIEDHNWDLVRDELRAECERGKYNYRFSKGLCADLERCYKEWESLFGGNE